MGMKDTDFKKQLKELLEEGNKLKSSFDLIEYPAVVKDDNEMAQINKFMTKSKVLISKHFGQESEYYKQVEASSSNPYRKECHLVLGVVTGLYENLESGYESLKESYTLSLKYDKIIEEMNLQDATYEEVIAEINGTYINYYFASMYIMVRKLLENLLYDCLKAFYGTQDIEKYYNPGKNRHQGYGVLIDSFNQMINDTQFKTIVGDVDQRFIDLLKEFQETGNRNAHSLFNLAHQDFIEERKDKINNFIKKLDWVLKKL